MLVHFTEPLPLYGKGDYALTDVKQMDVTDGFLSFDIKVRKCQNEESFLDCEKNDYFEIGRKKCNCVPHHLRIFSKPVSFLFRILHKYVEGVVTIINKQQR